MDIEFALKEYGLSDKESKVYITLLPLGSINLQEIAKRIDLPRTTIYNTLNYLMNKGLTSSIIKNKVTYYEATDPDKLIKTIEEKKALINSILPNLRILKETIKDNSSVEIFQGPRGVFTILSDVFSKKQQVYYFGSYSQSLEVLRHLPEHARTIRLENNIPAKIVIEHSDEESFHTNKYKKLTEMRFNNALKDFPCMIFIYGKKVAIYTLKKDLIGIIISNEQVAESFKIIFEIYWSNAKQAKL